MLDMSPLFVLVGVLVYLVVPALFLLAVYWVARLAVRHELRRTAPAVDGRGAEPGPQQR